MRKPSKGQSNGPKAAKQERQGWIRTHGQIQSLLGLLYQSPRQDATKLVFTALRVESLGQGQGQGLAWSGSGEGALEE